MAKKEIVEFKKGSSQFELIGRAKITDFTFELDKTSKTSDWIYNKLKLTVNCGNGNEVSCELMGGYGAKRNNVCYVHGKKESDKSTDEKKVYTDDFENQYTIDWEDRNDTSILKEVGEKCFKKAGIEKDTDGKIVIQKFVSPYDFIKYLSDNKDKINGQTVRVNGIIKYKVYNGALQKTKEIESIYVSKVEETEYKAEFQQTILFEKDVFGKKDKETNLYDINAYVVENLKDYDGEDITVSKKGKKVGRNIPLAIQMFAENENLEKLLKVKRGKVSEITVIGNIVEGKAKATIELKDLDDDMKGLVELGIYTLEDIAKTISVKGERLSQWIIRKPLVRMVGEEDNKTPQIVRTEEKYDEDDLILDFLNNKEEDTQEEVVDEEVSTNDEDWLKDLD